MSKRNPMYNLADTYARNMLEPLHHIIFLIGLYKGSEREEHMKCAADWIPQLEGELSSLKRALTNELLVEVTLEDGAEEAALDARIKEGRIAGLREAAKIAQSLHDRAATKGQAGVE